jgi:hypothetical protein
VGKTKDGGFLLTTRTHVVFVVDGPVSLVDNDEYHGTGYYLEQHQYTATDGATKTVRKFTCSRNVASEFWADYAAANAERETKKRTTDKPRLP